MPLWNVPKPFIALNETIKRPIVKYSYLLFGTIYLIFGTITRFNHIHVFVSGMSSSFFKIRKWYIFHHFLNILCLNLNLKNGNVVQYWFGYYMAPICSQNYTLNVNTTIINPKLNLKQTKIDSIRKMQKLFNYR